MAEDQRAVEARVEKAKTIREFIQRPKIMDQINAVIVTTLRPERFMRVFFSQMMLTPKILDCTNMSLLSTMIQSAQIGLEPILSRAALIPYGGEVTFQPMYRGHIYLARNTGKVRISSRVIFSKEKYRILYGSEEKIEHEPMIEWTEEGEEVDRGHPVGAYTIWTYEDGDQTFTFMPWAEILEIRNKYSKAWAKKGKESPWGERPYEMAKKTAIKNHAKMEPCSIYMDHAVNLDNRVETQGAATGAFLPAPGPQSKQFDPREVQERFFESAHELDKLTEDKAGIRFGDVPKLEEPGKEGEKEKPPSVQEQFTALMEKEILGYDPRLFLEYAQTQASQGNYPLDKFLDYCTKNPKEFAGHFVKWAGPPATEGAKPDQGGATLNFSKQYRSKRHSDDPKQGLLGWWSKNEKEILEQFPLDELKKVHRKFVLLGYSEREIPKTLIARLQEGDDGNKGDGESDPPAAAEGSSGPETGRTRIEIEFAEKAREIIEKIEFDYPLTIQGMRDHCESVWTGRARSYTEFLQRLVKNEQEFQDVLYEYMDLVRSQAEE